MCELLQLAIAFALLPISLLMIYIPASYVQYKEVVNIESNEFYWTDLTNLTVKMLQKKGYKVEHLFSGRYKIVKKDV